MTKKKKVAAKKAVQKSINDDNKFLKVLENVKGLSPEMKIKLAALLDEHDKREK